MSNGIILDAEDVRKILAERYGVSEKDVIKSQYSWIIKTNDKKEVQHDSETHLE